jgi:predicted MFS family arabinose efflux permease
MVDVRAQVPTLRGNPPVWWAAMAGLCANLVGIGIARFSYTPLIPVLITEQWFSAADATYLGAVNLFGYLAGALAGRHMARRTGTLTALRGMMLIAAASCFAGAYPLSFLWFAVWRFIAGYAGGVLMVLAAPAILPHVSPARRGVVSGIIFTGVGLGIAASGTLVPILLQISLVATWWGLGIVALLLTLAAWGGWPHDAKPVAVATAPVRRPSGPRLKALYVTYGLNAVGLTTHMVLLVDFIARALGQGLATGAQYWVLFGIGAALGPLTTGAIADRIGFAAAFRLLYVVQIACVLLIAVSTHPIALAVSSLIVGASAPGAVPLALGRVHELVQDAAARQAAWSVSATAYAIGQAVAAYGLSFFFAWNIGYTGLFETAAAVLALGLAIDLVTTAIARRTGR